MLLLQQKTKKLLILKKISDMKKTEQKNDNLEQIKRLLILALVHQGLQGKDIASVLGVDPAVISRLVPSRQIKKK